MQKRTGTIFKVYLLEKSAADKQEGFLEFWKHKGEMQRIHNVPFDYLDELPQQDAQAPAAGALRFEVRIWDAMCPAFCKGGRTGRTPFSSPR